jgi:hypothetical protein
MNITELYNAIIERLNKSGYETIATDLDNLTAAAATGGEGLESTGGYLFDLRKNNHKAYDVIKDLIAEYLKYCRQNGIIID